MGRCHSGTALVASFTMFVVIVLLVNSAQVRGQRIVTRTFSLLKDVQLPPRDCAEATGSRPTGTVQCASACDVMATCRGFSFTCTDLDPVSSCRCFLCSTVDMAASTKVVGVTSGVLVTQTSSSSLPFAPVPDPPLSPRKTPSSPLSPSSTTLPSSSAPPPPPIVASGPECPLPPLIARTAVSLQVTSTDATAHYSCNVSADMYAKGTTDVTCSSNGTWPEATILCAPTTCWYRHHHWGPVYGGNLSVTEDGQQCQPWALNQPQTKNPIYELDTMYPSDDDNKTAASNYCRVFEDDHPSVWCYWNQPSGWLGIRKYSNCAVPQCHSVPGLRLP